MGICNGVCINLGNGIKELKIENIETNKFLQVEELILSDKYPQIIYLQIRIKRYLKKMKNKDSTQLSIKNRNDQTRLNSPNIIQIETSQKYMKLNKNVNDINILECPKHSHKKSQSNSKINRANVDKTALNQDLINKNNQSNNEINDLLNYKKIRNNTNLENLISKDPFKSPTKKAKQKEKDKSRERSSSPKNKSIREHIKKSNKNLPLPTEDSNKIKNNINQFIIPDKLISDPRDQEHNDIRKSYPKIEEDGFFYIGEWKNGKRDGLGILSIKEQGKFIGQFKDNSILGFGVLFHKEGEKFVGYWNDLKANGIGFFISPIKSYLKGYWDNDKLNGYGLENWILGQYEGEYVNGNKQGIGKCNFEEGGHFEGELKDNFIHGIGTFIFKDGRKYQGMWKNSKMNGFGVIISDNNKNWFEGEFVDNKREGFGVYFTDKKIYAGMWRSSKLNGDIIIYENYTGNMKKIMYDNGKLVRNLPNDHKIGFEKLMRDIIKDYKNKNNIKSINN